VGSSHWANGVAIVARRTGIAATDAKTGFVLDVEATLDAAFAAEPSVDAPWSTAGAAEHARVASLAVAHWLADLDRGARAKALRALDPALSKAAAALAATVAAGSGVALGPALTTLAECLGRPPTASDLGALLLDGARCDRPEIQSAERSLRVRGAPLPSVQDPRSRGLVGQGE